MKKISTMLASAAVIVGSLSSFEAVADVNYIATPNPENMVESLSEVTLTFPDAILVDKGPQYENVTISTEGFSRSCTLEYGTDDNQMKVTFLKITESGTYTINIPEGAIESDYGMIEAFSITYKIGKEVTSTASMTPAPGEAEWLYDFIFSDTSAYGNLNVDTYGPAQPTLTTPNGEKISVSGIYDYQVGAGKYRFRTSRLITEPGEYTLTIPDNYISYNDQSYNKIYLPGCEFKYEVTGGELTEVISNPSLTEPTINFNKMTLEFPGYDKVSIRPMDYWEKNINVYRNGEEGSVASFYFEEGAQYFTVSGNKLNWQNQYTDLITPGLYHFTIPAGAVLLGEEGTPCTPFEIEFEIVTPKAAVIEVKPGNGETVSMLNSAVISFPEIEKVELARSASASLYKVITQDGEEKTLTIGGAYGQTGIERLSDNSFKANFSGLATEDGDYRIEITSNSFTYAGGYNQEYSVDVKFVAPAAPAYVMTPDPSEAQAKLQKFTITFPEESVVRLNAQLQSKQTTLYEGEELKKSDWGGYSNPQAGSTSNYEAVEGSSNSFSFALSSAGLNKGKYVLVIPAGIFLTGEDESSFNSRIEVVYECNGEGLDKIEATPSAPVRELKEISIEYVNESKISLQSQYSGFTLYQVVEGQSYGNYITYISGDNVKTEGNTLYLNLYAPQTAAGTYYIEITSYSLYMSDGMTTSTPQCVYFTVDPEAPEVGVETISEENGNARIYTLTGVEVKDMKTPGIYVVNGKKVVVKK